MGLRLPHAQPHTAGQQDPGTTDSYVNSYVTLASPVH